MKWITYPVNLSKENWTKSGKGLEMGYFLSQEIIDCQS